MTSYFCVLRPPAGRGSCVAAPHATADSYSDGPAPWGEVEGERIALILPRAAMERRRAEIPAAIKFWDSVVASHHRLATPPYGRRRERVVVDRQLSAGCANAPPAPLSQPPGTSLLNRHSGIVPLLPPPRC